MSITSFPAISNKKATILILGSMPGETSLRYQQYYAHSRNMFWQIMETITGIGQNLPYADRVTGLQEKGIALWDVLQQCERAGSLDANIQLETEIPNDFEGFFIAHPKLKYIFFNGRKAEKSFQKLVWPMLSKELQDRMIWATLPSTSPANARVSFADKHTTWQSQITAALQG